ncbi:MAG: helix-turn-helix transcriptional regulator [Planctomycetota bacterium]
MSAILDALRAKLEDSDETRKQISVGCGVAESQLSRFASGESGLGINSIEALADYLGLELVLRTKTKRKGTR